MMIDWTLMSCFISVILVVGIWAMQLLFAFIAIIIYVVKNRRSKLRYTFQAIKRF